MVHSCMVNNRLREIRKNKEISQLRLSQITGIAPSTISCIEKGKQYVFPGWKKRLASALEISESEIFPEESFIERRA